MKKFHIIKLLLLFVMVTSMLIGWLIIQISPEPTQTSSIIAYKVIGKIEHVDSITGKLTALEDQEKIFPYERVISHKDGYAIFELKPGKTKHLLKL